MSEKEKSYKQLQEEMASSEKYRWTVLKEIERLLDNQAKEQAKSVFEEGMCLNEKLRVAERKVQQAEILLKDARLRAQELAAQKDAAEAASRQELDIFKDRVQELQDQFQTLQHQFESQRRTFDRSSASWSLEKKDFLDRIHKGEERLKNSRSARESIVQRHHSELDQIQSELASQSLRHQRELRELKEAQSSRAWSKFFFNLLLLSLIASLVWSLIQIEEQNQELDSLRGKSSFSTKDPSADLILTLSDVNTSPDSKNSRLVQVVDAAESIELEFGEYNDLIQRALDDVNSASDVGKISCWGGGLFGQPETPNGVFTHVAAGSDHFLGIRKNGTIACWGQNIYGQCDAPSGVVTQVSAGEHHSIALRENGRIECWGSNSSRQCDAPRGIFTQVAAGASHSIGLRENGTIECWGSNSNGQCNAPEGVFAQVVGGYAHSIGIRKDGTISCWGWNIFGQCDAPDDVFTQVACGFLHSIGIREDGTIACWGSNSDGECDAPSGVFIQVAAGTDYSVGLRENGMIECWGKNHYGQCDAPDGLFTQISSRGRNCIGLGLMQPVSR